MSFYSLQFEKPGKGEHDDYPAMAKEATFNALKDAGITYDQVQQAAVGYCYGDSTCGQKALYEIGMTGIPIYNVRMLPMIYVNYSCQIVLYSIVHCRYIL